MTPPPRTEAEEAYWATYAAFLTHTSGCAGCRKTTCPTGTRLGQAHRHARALLSKERTTA